MPLGAVLNTLPHEKQDGQQQEKIEKEFSFPRFCSLRLQFHPLTKRGLAHFDAVLNLRPFLFVAFCGIVDPFPERIYKAVVCPAEQHADEDACYKRKKDAHVAS